MTLQKTNARTLVLITLIIAATAMRLASLQFPFLSNFTPLGAVAMFGGVYFTDKWKAYLTVLLTFFVSDVIINHSYTGQWSLWSSYTFWNCVCFSIVVLIGSFIKKINVGTSVVILFAPVIVHWLVMDLPWVNDANGLYPHTLIGYGEALIAAIPFEKNMLLGDAVFGAILFGGFELAKSKYAVLRPTRELAL